MNTIKPQRLTSIRDANVTLPKGEPIITSDTKMTIAKTPEPRFAVTLPEGYISAIDSRECRGWARSVG